MKKIFLSIVALYLFNCSSLDKVSSSDSSIENNDFKIDFSIENSTFGKSKKQSNGISYQNDLGELYKFEYIVLAEEDLDKLKNGSVKESDLVYFFGNNHYYKNLILPNIPTAKIIYEDMLKDDKTKFNYAMILFLPLASTFTINDKRQDIHRGAFMFRHKQYLFLLQNQESFGIEPNGVSKKLLKTKEEIIKELVTKFFLMKSKIQFK